MSFTTVSVPPDRVEARLDPVEGKVSLSIYEDGEVVAQPDMNWERAIELASDILTTALAVKHRRTGIQYSDQASHSDGRRETRIWCDQVP
jgi:hypothetical protein